MDENLLAATIILRFLEEVAGKLIPFPKPRFHPAAAPHWLFKTPRPVTSAGQGSIAGASHYQHHGPSCLDSLLVAAMQPMEDIGGFELFDDRRYPLS